MLPLLAFDAHCVLLFYSLTEGTEEWQGVWHTSRRLGSITLSYTTEALDLKEDANEA